MTLDDFEIWLNQHPEYVHPTSTSPFQASNSQLELPLIYRQFLQRFGSMRVFNYTLLSEPRIIEATEFIHGLSYPEEGIDYGHFTTFCSLGYDNCYLCFHGTKS